MCSREQELNPEVKRWKVVAAYLAECHAATLSSLPKSTSKSERKRQIKLCRKAAAMLEGKEEPPSYMLRDALIDLAVKRCLEAANSAEHETDKNPSKVEITAQTNLSIGQV